MGISISGSNRSPNQFILISLSNNKTISISCCCCCTLKPILFVQVLVLFSICMGCQARWCGLKRRCLRTTWSANWSAPTSSECDVYYRHQHPPPVHHQAAGGPQAPCHGDHHQCSHQHWPPLVLLVKYLSQWLWSVYCAYCYCWWNICHKTLLREYLAKVFAKVFVKVFVAVVGPAVGSRAGLRLSPAWGGTQPATSLLRPDRTLQ